MGVFTAMGIRRSRDGVFTSDAVVMTTEVPGMSTMIVHSSNAAAPGRSTMMSGTAPPIGTEPATEGEDSMVEEVGKIIDDSQQAEGATDPSQNSSQDREDRNPKKRMWEEPVEAQKEEQRKKDEL